jgi:hypothetical protein
VSTTDPIFLDQDQILIIHRHAIVNIGQTSAEDYDATLWVMDFNLLESALFAPQQTFGGAFLYTHVADMAAAYWFGFAKIMRLLTATSGLRFLRRRCFWR